MQAKYPDFKRLVENARQYYADHVEGLLHGMAEGTRRGNVVAAIVLAKKHRPQDFVERHQVLQANISTEPDSAVVRALLKEALSLATDETRRSLAAAPDDVLEASGTVVDVSEPVQVRDR